jgi:hypothetical protein
MEAISTLDVRYLPVDARIAEEAANGVLPVEGLERPTVGGCGRGIGVQTQERKTMLIATATTRQALMCVLVAMARRSGQVPTDRPRQANGRLIAA